MTAFKLCCGLLAVGSANEVLAVHALGSDDKVENLYRGLLVGEVAPVPDDP